MAKRRDRSHLPLSLLSLAAVLALIGCSGRQEDSTRRFVVIDQPSGSVVGAYDYEKDADVLVRTTAYGADEKAKRVTDYYYDSDGELAKIITQEPGDHEVATTVRTFQVDKVYDSGDRLTKTVQTADDGTVVETYYGYDETGELRGVVQKDKDVSLIMKDY